MQSKAAFQQSEVEFTSWHDPLHYDMTDTEISPSHRVLCTGVKHLVRHDPGNLTRIDIGASTELVGDRRELELMWK